MAETKDTTNVISSNASDCEVDSEISQTSPTPKILNVVYGIGMNVNAVIGSGIVTSPGVIWKAVKSPVIVLLLWFICGIVAMSGSLSYVELGVMHRISGGETRYLKTAYPCPERMMSYLFSFMYIL
jgi:amino acid transporter